MNWMTSGRHRALRSARNKQRRERNFPAHVREKAAQQAAVVVRRREASGDAQGTAWYIRPIRDENESHDIQMLELSREVATGIKPARETERKSSPVVATEIEKRKEKEESEKKAVAGRRCVFTPVKGKRAAGGLNTRPKKKLPSPPPRDMLFFNEGEQVSKSADQLATTTQLKTQKVKIDMSRWTDESSSMKSRSEVEPFYASSSSSTDSPSCQPHDRDETRKAGFFRLWTKPDISTNQYESITKPPGMMDALECALQGERARDRVVSSFSGIDGPNEPLTMHDEQSIFVPNPHEPHRGEYCPPDQLPLTPSHLCEQRHAFTSRLSPQSIASDIPEALRMIKMEYESPASDSDLPLRCSRSERLLPSKVSSPTVQSQDSSSSHDSFTLPPPMNWHKHINAHPGNNDLGAFAPGDGQVCSSGLYHANPDEVETVAPSQYDRLQKWSCCLRTKGILNNIQDHQGNPVNTSEKPTDPIQRLRQKLREERAKTLYLHILIRCHKINEKYQGPSSDEIRGVDDITG